MALSDLFLPTRCVGCGRQGASPCEACLASLHPARLVRIGAETVVAATVYDELSRAFVVDLKTRGRRSSVAWIAAAVAGTVRWAAVDADVITWVPASHEGRRRRGFDQGHLLARAVGRELGLPAARLLARRRGGRQVGGDRVERLAGAAGVRVASRAGMLAGARVLVVDDVVTTGASMRAAMRALSEAGASATPGAAFAHKE